MMTSTTKIYALCDKNSKVRKQYCADKKQNQLQEI
jgi:hypothetical protein